MTRPEQAREVDQNYDAFRRMLGSLLVEHRDTYALMRAREVVDYYPTAGHAYREGLRRFADAVFSIQEVTDEPIDLGFWSHV